MVDFIFVHGLGGGSRKTWSKGPDPKLFWPKEWLSRDPEFKHVRLHSFGYNSNWTERKGSVLDVYAFGKGLLAAMQGSPLIRRGTNVGNKHVNSVNLVTDSIFLASYCSSCA